MQASDVSQYLKESSKDPENLWLIVAWVVFFPLVLAWALWRAINQGAYRRAVARPLDEVPLPVPR